MSSLKQAFVLCPGQGAQRVGMGSAWRDASSEAAAVFERADSVLSEVPTWQDSGLGLLSAICKDGPDNRINRTDVSQPALFVTAIASWHALCASTGVSPSDAAADLAGTAGLSLGEYTALAVARAISFEDGLRLVALRGYAMQRAAESNPGGMVALIGADESQADVLCDQCAGAGTLVVANINAPGQVVVAGDKDACERAVAAAGEAGLRATALPVAGAFHSPLMREAADRLAESLDETEIRMPACPVLSNVTADPHGTDTVPGDEVEFASSVRERLEQQLMSPVRWAESLDRAVGLLIRETTPVLELAPGKTLAGLMRRIDKSVKVATHDQPEPEPA